MKHVLFLVPAMTLFIATAGCDDDSPTDPSGETVTLLAQLSPASEIPPVTGPEASGSGSVRITFRLERNSSNTITDAEADFEVTLAGFPPNTPLTMAHIHDGNASEVGDIVVNTGLVTGQVTLTTGSGSFVRDDIDVSPALAQQIIDAPAEYYFNVHSVLNAAGMARGQLNRE